MLLQNKQTGTLIEILDVESLVNPAKSQIPGRVQEGEEEQDTEQFAKDGLVFPSGEALPKCWLNADYRLA